MHDLVGTLELFLLQQYIVFQKNSSYETIVEYFVNVL